MIKLIKPFISLLLVLCSLAVNATVIFSEDFSDNNAGWTLEFEWQIGPTTVSAGQNASTNPDPEFDHSQTGDNGVAGVVIGGNATTIVHPFSYLTSPVINADVAGDVTFEYWRWLNSDYSPFMKNTIQVFDGSAWNSIWETFGSPGITDNAWTLNLFDITAYRNSNLQIRFGHQVGSTGAFTVSSWNIDDISITTSSVPLPPSILLFGTGFLGLIGVSRRERKKQRKMLGDRSE